MLIFVDLVQCLWMPRCHGNLPNLEKMAMWGTTMMICTQKNVISDNIYNPCIEKNSGP